MSQQFRQIELMQRYVPEEIRKGENCREGEFTLAGFVEERNGEIKSKRCQSSSLSLAMSAERLEEPITLSVIYRRCRKHKETLVSSRR